MKRFLILLVALAPIFARGESPRLNVLHIVSDDLCARLHCYGDPLVKSPNIDRLAARGVQFDRAYCQFPLCNPSRASFMTGLRPDTTGVFENATQFRKNVPDAVSIPQSFQKAGYSVARVGKLYHYGVPTQIGTDGLDDSESWEKVVNPRGRDIDDIGMVEVLTLGADGKATTTTGKELKNTGGTLSWLAAEGTDAEQTDGKGAAAAIELLEARAKESKPFYLAVGFYRPHTPYISPKPYFALYPVSKILLPKIAANLNELFPAPALGTHKAAELAMSDDLRRQVIQAYHASTTFMDAQVGKVLDALDRLKLTEKTVVIFHSDHGYHLGEKNLWQKMSIFEESARVPLIISIPGNPNNGRTCARTVELVDLHKTLADACGIAAGAKTEGASLLPLLKNPEAAWDRPAYSQVTRGLAVGTFEAGNKNAGKKGIMGRSVRTERWRYTEWDEGRAGVELYDHDADPQEMKNLAGDTAFARSVAAMKKLLTTPQP
jgi:iduronate 2-sulfatase